MFSAVTYGASYWAAVQHMNENKSAFEQTWTYTDTNNDGWYELLTEIDAKTDNPVLVKDFADLTKPFSEWDTAELHSSLGITSGLFSAVFAVSALVLLYQLCQSPAYKAFKARLRLTGRSQ
jgi:hypothetical protein